MAEARTEQFVLDAMGGMYENPREAYDNLMALDDGGIERLRNDTSEIGTPRKGVEPDTEAIEGLIQ